MELALSARPLSSAHREESLVDAARAGDDRAFEQLYARYRERIHAFILSRVRDHGRAEDLGQEVFMSALHQLRATDRPIVFKPWLYAIAKNACIDEFRRAQRGREVPIESDETLAAAPRPLLSAVPTPTSAIESKQRLQDLRGAFDGLSESQHRLLVMREFEGQSYDEIGERLGMTRQMVESGLFRARRKLTEEYDELATGRRCEQIQSAIDAGAMRTTRGVGIRERRRWSQHLAHCGPCRHQAQIAGVDGALLRPRSIGAKIAALLPIPLWRWPWSRGGRRGPGGPGANSNGARLGAARAASQHVAAGALQNAAALGGSAGSSVGLGRAAAVAALAVAGAGGGLVAAQHDGSAHRHVTTARAHALRHAPAAGSAAGARGPAGAGRARPASGAAGRAAGTASRHRVAAGGAPTRAHGARPAPTSAAVAPAARRAATSARGRRSSPTRRGHTPGAPTADPIRTPTRTANPITRSPTTGAGTTAGGTAGAGTTTGGGRTTSGRHDEDRRHDDRRWWDDDDRQRNHRDARPHRDTRTDDDHAVEPAARQAGAEDREQHGGHAESDDLHGGLHRRWRRRRGHGHRERRRRRGDRIRLVGLGVVGHGLGVVGHGLGCHRDLDHAAEPGQQDRRDRHRHRGRRCRRPAGQVGRVAALREGDAVEYTGVIRGVAQPGSAHRSGR